MSEINGYKVLTGTGLRAWPDQPREKPSEVMPYGGPPSVSVQMYREGEYEAMGKAVRFRGEVDPNNLPLNTPGAKADAGKVRPALVLGGFARALLEVSKVGTYGAVKYTENGWVEVPNGEARYDDADMRHWLKEKIGETCDPDTDLMHAAHKAWNSLARLDLLLREREKAKV